MAAGSDVKIASFSQNSETSTAYIYDKRLNTDTGQKILPGNLEEMDLRGLMDVWDGTDVSLVKPIENYCCISNLRSLLTDDAYRNKFLSSSFISNMYDKFPQIRSRLDRIVSDPDEMKKRCESALVGGYTVSGTSMILLFLANHIGDSSRWARQREIWLTARAACGERFWGIVDRSAYSMIEFGHSEKRAMR